MLAILVLLVFAIFDLLVLTGLILLSRSPTPGPDTDVVPVLSLGPQWPVYVTVLSGSFWTRSSQSLIYCQVTGYSPAKMDGCDYDRTIGLYLNTGPSCLT
jgi:hypothetical protein